ncbi:PRC-barrel domain-containing protein [Aliihoeflea sp. PC F10.4]
MFAKKLSLAIVASGLLAGTAFAQSTWVEIEDDNVQVTEFGANVDQVEDWDVYDAAGTDIGDVEEVIGTDPATPTALVIDFNDDAGYVDGDVIIPLDQFTYENNRLVLNADAAAVGSFELWTD